LVNLARAEKLDRLRKTSAISGADGFDPISQTAACMTSAIRDVDGLSGDFIVTVETLCTAGCNSEAKTGRQH
jgi:hypothetical protein